MKTASDVMQDLFDYLGELGSGQAVRAAREAIQEGLRELSNVFCWSYYKRIGRVDTVARYNAGTVTYTHTGGATSERQLTLAGGTWPTWSGSGVVVISNVPYLVQERRSGTVLQLESTTNPGSDVAAGTSYQIYRWDYDLPSKFRSIFEPVQLSSVKTLGYLTPEEWSQLSARQPTNVGQPLRYAIMPSQDTWGRMAMYFYPFPDAIYRIHFLYLAHPREVTIFEYKDGTVTTTSSSATVTGSGTSWTSRMVGSVFRLSDAANKWPTGYEGDYPHVHEAKIIEVTSGTSIRLDTVSPATAYSGVKYVISDPIDVEEGAMLTAFSRATEKQLAAKRRLTKAGEAANQYMAALQLAMAGDSRPAHERFAGDGWYRRPVGIGAMPWGGDLP